MHELLCSRWRYSPERSSTYYVFFQKYLLTSSLTPVSSEVPEQRGHPVTSELWGHRHRKEKCKQTAQCVCRQTYSLSRCFSLFVFRSSEIEKSRTTIFINYFAVIAVLLELLPPPPPCQFYLLFSNALSLPLSCGIDFLLFSSS